MCIGTDREQRARASRADKEFPVRHAIAFVDLDGDTTLDAQVDQPLLPFLGIDAFGIAERLERGERGVAEDVDAIVVDALGDDLERLLENPPLKRGVRETLPLLPALDAPLHERSRVVVLDARAVELDLMDRTDHVVQRLACPRTERGRDPEVVLETHAEPEPRGIVDVALHGIFVWKLVAPGVVVRHTVRPQRDALCTVGERHRSVRAVAVHVMVEECAQSSGCPAQAASTMVQRTPDTSVCPPRRSGNGAWRAASVNSRSGFDWMRSAMKRYDANRSAAPGRHPRCAKRTSVSKSIPSQSSCMRAKNSRGPIFSYRKPSALRASPDVSRPAACMPRSSASMRTRHAVCVSMNVQTGAPTRPATRSVAADFASCRDESPACWCRRRGRGLSVAGRSIASSADAGVNATRSAEYELFERTTASLDSRSSRSARSSLVSRSAPAPAPMVQTRSSFFSWTIRESSRPKWNGSVSVGRIAAPLLRKAAAAASSFVTA